MVVQRDAPVPVWGQAMPGECVTVTFKTQDKTAVGDAAGQWKIYLDPMPASKEPSSLLILANLGQKEFNNVLVEQVWLCSGQSNMQTSWNALETAENIQNADNPQIRLFTAPRSGVGRWASCTTEEAGSFSATGYYFGVNLWKQLQVPVGIIVAAEGSSSIETWMPPESVLAVMGLSTKMDPSWWMKWKGFNDFSPVF